MSILLKCLQKISNEETLSNSFHKANITLTPKPDKNITTERKLPANITNEHRCKNFQQNSSKESPTTR